MLRTLSLTLLLITSITPAMAQGKTAVDPNTTKPVQAANPLPVGATDKRLDQKVTYYKGNIRLHDAIYALSEMSGVTIYCGRSNEDWRTRDIPVTVAASKLPLRKMLEYITCCTNTVLTSKKTEKGGITYRVVMNPRLKQSMDAFIKARAEHVLAWDRQNIEIAAKLKDIPASQITPPSDAQQDWQASMNFEIETSKILSGLTEGQIDQILAGEPLVLSPKDAPAEMRAQLISCLDAFDEMYLESRRICDPGDESVAAAQRATNAELEESRLKIGRESIGLTVTGCVTLPEGAPERYRVVGYGLTSITNSARDYNRGNFALPAELVYPEVPKADLPDNYKELTEGMPGYVQSVTLKLEDKNKPVYACDVLIALSKTAGVPIVYVDFWSHQNLWDCTKAFGKEREFIKTILNNPYDKWMVDTSTHAIIGFDTDWVTNYQQLIPASIMENLTAKAYGDGVDLDDLAQLASCDKQGVLEWANSRVFPEFPDYGFSTSPNSGMWAVYDSLSSGDKARARSESGLGLDKNNIAIVEKWLTSKIKLNAADLWTTPEAASRADSEIKRLLDPAVLPNLVLGIQTNIFDRQPGMAQTASTTADSITIPPGFTKQTRYTLYIAGEDKDGRIKYTVDNVTLPYFHPDRRTALNKALLKQSSTSAPTQRR